MSSQAERIKAFKLAQHARLQKQDEEEQWISSEELCTEGSSDEETHTSSSSKTSHRKQKRNPRTEKRGISPLAQPPKATETESTSTYQRDSKYLLPDIYSSNKFPEIQSTSGVDRMEILKLKADDLKSVDTKVEMLDLGSSQAHSSKACSSSLESEETDEDAEIEKMIQWRPKRGSIKLPDFPEGHLGKPSTIEHAIFEANAFYTEMVARINCLKRTPPKVKYIKNDGCEMGSLISSLEKNRCDSTVNTILEKIFKLDTEITLKNETLEMVKKERLLAQEEMCNAINDLDVSPTHQKNSQIFLHLCNFEKPDSEKDNKENDENNKTGDQQEKKQKKTEKPDKDFVKRNVELANQRMMAKYSLTDEEKVKLESLLSDIDSEEYSVGCSDAEIPKRELKPTRKQTEKEKEIYESSIYNPFDEVEDVDVNHFKLEKEEMSSMTDLNVKLHEIQNSYDEEERSAKQALLQANDGEDMFQSADNEGRYWKHHLFQKRLETIDKDLAKLLAKEAEELKKLQKQNQQCLEENNKEEEKDDNSDYEEKE